LTMVEWLLCERLLCTGQNWVNCVVNVLGMSSPDTRAGRGYFTVCRDVGLCSKLLGCPLGGWAVHCQSG